MTRLWCLTTCTLMWMVHTHPCPTRRRVDTQLDAMVYLQRLGYIRVAPLGEMGEMSDKEWTWAVRTFQRKARVHVTGKLDEPTMDMLNKPRCGVYDVTEEERMEALSEDKVSRRKRFAVSEGKWPKTELTYRISQYTSDLANSIVNSIIAQAFLKWSSVTPLTFVLHPHGSVDLDIRFVSELHGDNAPFDGPGGTLAHAFFPPTSTWVPPISGDAHFDEAETWIEVNARTGTPLLCVAIHEIGHTLGLRHSDDHGAIMWPWAGECRNDTDLGQDDISAIQHLYGAKERAVTLAPETSTGIVRTEGAEVTTGDVKLTTAGIKLTSPGLEMTSLEAIDTTESMSEETPISETGVTEGLTPIIVTTNAMILQDMTSPVMTTTGVAMTTDLACDGRVDAMLHTDDGYVYAFRGNKLFRLHKGVAQGFPCSINEVFPGGPSYVTAAMTSHKRNGKRRSHRRHARGRRKPETTYLFSDDQVWRYQYDRRRGSFRTVRGSNPAHIARVFPGVHASSIGGATVSADNGDIYLFSGEEYWRHKGERKRLSSRTYPRPWAHHPIFSHVGTDPASTIDAALLHRDQNYFFSDQNFFRWDRVNRRMSRGRDTAYFLFWCPGGVNDRGGRRAEFSMEDDRQRVL